MKTRLSGILAMSLTMILALVVVSWATVPPPPVNQVIGIPDGVFNNLDEAGCRACHGDSSIVNPGSVPDRHHLIVGDTIIDPTAAPHGTPGDLYECLSCHELEWDPGTSSYVFVNFRDCLLCHVQVAGVASVHHMTAAANAQDCKACHGQIDNPLDGHYVPTYDPSMVTPLTGIGTGAGGEGGCAFCHAAGTDDVSGFVVSTNADTHHGTGIGQVGSGSTLPCITCHAVDAIGTLEAIRGCEVCHGVGSLHNIQADSPNPANPGTIVPGLEDAYWGHIGHNDDCNGCHANAAITAAPYSGAVAPNISELSAYRVTGGSPTTITVTGSAFTNQVVGPDGPIDLFSDIILTGVDDAETTLVPDTISEASMMVTIPADLAPGNYDLRAIKGPQTSNCVNLSVMPAVIVTSATCKDGIVTIIGSGFGLYVDATGSGTGVTLTAPTGDYTIISWTDTMIVADFGDCISGSEITVDSVYGAASADVVVKKQIIRRPLRR